MWVYVVERAAWQNVFMHVLGVVRPACIAEVTMVRTPSLAEALSVAGSVRLSVTAWRCSTGNQGRRPGRTVVGGHGELRRLWIAIGHDLQPMVIGRPLSR
jgi:hypothetical protein